MTDTLEYWKAIAQTHNDSLVERIAENERLRAENGLLMAENRTAHIEENERLAEQVADYDEQITSLYAERARLEAENERLREALEKIVDADKMGYGTRSYPDIARAALNRVDESALSAEFDEHNTKIPDYNTKGSWRGRIADNERWKSKP
jgi:chromosome segregation ATPase